MDTSKLRDYQAESALVMQAAFEKHGSALNGSETGTGKTYTTCAMIRHYDAPTVVVAPLPLLPAWRRVGDFMGVEFDVINYDMLRTGRTPYGHFTTVRKRSNGKEVRKFHWSSDVKLAVFDEAHRCKAWSGGLNSAIMIAARRQGIPSIALTATPATTPLDMKALGYLLGLHNGSDYWKWLGRHGCGKDWMGRMDFLGNSAEREAHMEKLRGEIFPEHGVRVRKRDVPGFPTTQIIPELYQIAQPGLIDQLYAEMEAEMAKLRARRDQDLDPDHALTKLVRLREQVELLKVPVFLELIHDAHEQGQSVVVFVNFRETVWALSRRLAHVPHGTLVGGMPRRQFQQTVDDFQANEFRALISVAECGSVGLGLHDVHGGFPRQVLISPPWSALTFEQEIGRACRDGGKSHSDQRVVLADGTVERAVYKSLSDKLSTQSALTDEDFAPWTEKYPLRRVEDFCQDLLDKTGMGTASCPCDDRSGLSSMDLSEKPEVELEADDEIPF